MLAANSKKAGLFFPIGMRWSLSRSQITPGRWHSKFILFGEVTLPMKCVPQILIYVFILTLVPLVLLCPKQFVSLHLFSRYQIHFPLEPWRFLHVLTIKKSPPESLQLHNKSDFKSKQREEKKKITTLKCGNFISGWSLWFAYVPEAQ